MKSCKTIALLSAILAVVTLTACGGGSGSASTSSASSSSAASSANSSTASSAASSSSASLAPANFIGAADGWASTGTGTTGGTGADAAHTYTVTTRSQFIKAMYPDAVIAADGTFTGTADTTKKIIYVKGTISLNANAAGTELTGDDYFAGTCLTALQATYPAITNLAQMYAKYYELYAPNVWNTTLTGGKPPAVSGPVETARACGSAKQTKVVRLGVVSNTSLLGYDASAKIIHGNLTLDPGVDNVIIRNITFEDSFDFFTGWDPTDSFPSVSATADASGCSTTTPTKCVGGRWNSNYDLISVQGATHVWIDHNTLSDGTNIDHLYPPVASWNFGGNAQLPEQKIQHHDGLVDVTKQSDMVTLSYNVFKDHDKTGLLGGGDSAAVGSETPLVLRTTYHHNYYQNNKQRQPRARWGQAHVYNNYYTGTLANADGSGPDYPWLTAWTSATSSKLYIENNVVEIANSPDGSKVVADANVAGISSSASNYTKCTAVAGKTWTNTDCETHFYDAGNLLNGVALDAWSVISAAVAGSSSNYAIVNDKATTPYWIPSTKYAYTLDAATAVKAKVLTGAGAGKL